MNKGDNDHFDVICLGRAGVDLYADQIGSRLEDVSSFSKYIGGSSCNIAAGSSRLGLKTSMLTRVGDDQMGRFIREQLEREGVDVSHVKSDPKRLSGLVLLGIKDRESFPLLFYRENCADMALDENDFDEDYIKKAKALLITGTHLSNPHVKKVSQKALELAKKNGLKKILDIDYRPVLWGLTGKGEGENRFVESKDVTSHIQDIVSSFDLIVGTEEEFHIAGGSKETLEALKVVRSLTQAILVLKQGPQGSKIFDGDIPQKLEEGISGKAPEVKVLNVLGAGDAFMSGFLKGYLKGEELHIAATYANACGALVVSRHGCTPAMPSWTELESFISRQDLKRPDLDDEINDLHRTTTGRTSFNKDLFILAFDHRSQFLNELSKAGIKDLSVISKVKNLIFQGFEMALEKNNIELKSSGLIVDEEYGEDVLHKATGTIPFIGRPVEIPGSRPLQFIENIHLKKWPNSHIVKCLCHYHPGEKIELRLQQEEQIEKIYSSCLQTGHEFLLEIIPPKNIMSNKGPDEKEWKTYFPDHKIIPQTMERFYNLGIKPDWWKLPPPSPESWDLIEELLDRRSPHSRGVFLLGLNKPLKELQKSFQNSKGRKWCKGFAIGRTVFMGPLVNLLKKRINESEFVDQVQDNYFQMIQVYKEARE
ncbi:MAG: 5-dehydro-2-deoxygluconokinase [Bdellovibrionota bacterium]|nr:5-dehydro-2-deoxygluconokinase [Bdellovibrionota bacterium]